MSDSSNSGDNGTPQDPTSGRWNRLRDLLGEALELEPAERAAYLQAACAGDAVLLAEIEALLAAHGAAGPLDEVAGLLSDVMPEGAATQIGRRIGPYRLVEIIGHGGMGAVYLAQRADGQFEQRVALKLIQFGVPSGEVVRRFLEERQILARLEHPNIARLLEGGVTDDGQPYFAMEYVDGSPIHEYCDANRLDIAARLALFDQICSAVQYAHQNLVVHRDLKPSNILVTDAGRVILLDFGIAKLLPGNVAEGAAQTRTGLRWLTPEYASPEQIRGEPVTTASDLYALGVLLYELLTGQRPYRIPSSASPGEIERVVCNTEPERPSVVVMRDAELHAHDGTVRRLTAAETSSARNTQPNQLRRRLTGDLDTIVLHALQKDPRRRYGSATQLAEDLQQYLAGLPVRARPDTLRYRTAKFVRRHRVGVAASALVVLTLFGGIAGTTWQARNATEQGRIARNERDRARSEAAKAAQVSAFLTDLFKAADPRQALGDTITARHILERGVARVDAELAAQPAVRATMLDVIGTVYRNLGNYEQAEALLRKALDLRRAALRPDDPELAQSLMHLGIHLHMYQNRSDAAEPLLREALDIWSGRLHQENQDVASVLSSLGELQMMRGQIDVAADYFRRALETRRRVLGSENRAVAMDLDNLATVLLHADLRAADSLYDQSLVLRRKLLRPDHFEIARSLDGLAAVRSQQEQWDASEDLHRQSLAIKRKAYAPSNPEISMSLQSLARIAEQKGDLAGAEDFYREVLTIRREAFGPDEVATGGAMVNLAAVQHARGNCAAAEPLLRAALVIYQRKYKPADPRIGSPESILGACASQGGRYREGERLLLHANELLKGAKGLSARTAQRTRQFLAEHYERTGQPEKAAQYRAASASRPTSP